MRFLIVGYFNYLWPYAITNLVSLTQSNHACKYYTSPTGDGKWDSLLLDISISCGRMPQQNMSNILVWNLVSLTQGNLACEYYPSPKGDGKGASLLLDISISCGIRPQQIICNIQLPDNLSWPEPPGRYFLLTQGAHKRLKTLVSISS